ncbi:reverse transcriptase [Elysia marginata]|uniref:Reverse transcriptase n=1 Tax=Elysia marginata TaxID=1093978 RepID=A0AAV4IQT1_9GAST|nr:reverse transcriptase [Elysia marginata]
MTENFRQECVLSPMLFNFVLNWIMTNSLILTDGVSYYSEPGKLVDLTYREIAITIAELEDRLSLDAAALRLNIKPNKTKIIFFHFTAPPYQYMYGDTIENVKEFTYLGSAINEECIAASDSIPQRNANISQTFQRL